MADSVFHYLRCISSGEKKKRFEFLVLEHGNCLFVVFYFFLKQLQPGVGGRGRLKGAVKTFPHRQEVPVCLSRRHLTHWRLKLGSA